MSSNPSALRTHAKDYLCQSAATMNAAAEHCLDSILKAAEMIGGAFKHGGKIMLCGNGGSAADCQHMAAEFVGVLNKAHKRSGLPAIALTTDTSFLTAYANDWGYDEIFERQVRTLGQADDVLICISTSGTSANILRGISAARDIGIRTIALTGAKGMRETTDVSINVPATGTQHIQEAHVAIEHLICELVESDLFDSARLVEHTASALEK